MKERNIPAFEGDDYSSISHPTTLRTFKNALEDIHVYTDTGIAMVYAGEVGRYESDPLHRAERDAEGSRQRRCVHRRRRTMSITSTRPIDDAWTNGLSSWCLFFGADTVIEAPAVPEEIRAKLPQDFGRDNAVAYYYMGEAGLCHTDALNARVVLWDSADLISA